MISLGSLLSTTIKNQSQYRINMHLHETHNMGLKIELHNSLLTVCTSPNGVHLLEISFATDLQVSYFSPSLTSEHKGAHAGYKPGEEGVEGEGAHETAVKKLYNARQHHVGQICVHQLQPLRRARLILF